MIRHDPRLRLLAISLALLAGYVDALGFIRLGGFFVSFMSGNSTRLGVGLAHGPSDAAIAAGLIASFVAGVVAGTLTGRAWYPMRGIVVLALVGLLLALAAGADLIGIRGLSIIAMAAAMGAANATFERDGEVSIGVTYMTGTLVKMGQRIADALSGGHPLAWLWYLLLWLGLVAGATIGTLIYPSIGLQGLWAAVAVIAAQAVIASRLNLAAMPVTGSKPN